MPLRPQELCRREPWAPGRFNYAGLVCGRGARQKQYAGSPGWGLGAGLTTLPCKTGLMCHLGIKRMMMMMKMRLTNWRGWVGCASLVVGCAS